MKLPYGVARQYGRCARDVVERASRRRPLSSSTLTSSIDSNNNNSSSRNGQQAQSAAADAIGDGWMEGLTRHERKRLMRRGPVGYVTVGQQKQLREEWGRQCHFSRGCTGFFVTGGWFPAPTSSQL